MLAPKSSIVTGGSGAIGKAIACLLASHGSSVAICGRRLPPLEAACADISRALPPSCTGSVRPYVCDVTQEADAVALFSACSDVDLLVNSAGIAAGGPTSELSKSTFQNVLDVNVLGPFLCSREAMKHMASRGTGGRIINVGSISAYSPRPNSAPYTTSKFALDGLTRSLALDGREMGIAVGMVHPGNVMSDLLTPDEIARREDTEGFISAEDVANCVLTMAQLPLNANILELCVMPTKQPLVGRG